MTEIIPVYYKANKGKHSLDLKFKRNGMFLLPFKRKNRTIAKQSAICVVT